jgi:hypothetical protein
MSEYGSISKEAQRRESMTRRAIWLPLGLFAAALVGLIGLSAQGAQAGGTATVTAGSGTVVPGGSITVDLTVTPSGTLVGALDVTIGYDAAVLDATPDNLGTATCNEGVNPITCSFANLAGLTGVVASLQFDAVGADGTSSALTVVVTTCSDEIGTDITCTPGNGLVNVQAATPTPVPTAVPTAAPTAAPTTAPTAVPATITPAGLPPTGSDSGSNALPLFLAAMGIAAVTAGAWAVTRLRREQI